jgi:hypothetical protein
LPSRDDYDAKEIGAMSVRELREMLDGLRVSHRDCLEKAELVTKLTASSTHESCQTREVD